MENLPIFNYKSIKPLITASVRTTQVRFYPQGFNNFTNGISPNSYVKFDFRTNGFWDPKSAYIHIEVTPTIPSNMSIATTTSIWQIDNSANSLFSQLIIRHNGVELERTTEYDSLCAMIYDMNVGLGSREFSDLQGLGKSRSGFNPFWNSKVSQPFITNIAAASTGGSTGSSTGNGTPLSGKLINVSLLPNYKVTAGSLPNNYGYNNFSASNVTNAVSAATSTYGVLGMNSSPFRPYLGLQRNDPNSTLGGINFAAGTPITGTMVLPHAMLAPYFESFIQNENEGVEMYLGGYSSNFSTLMSIWTGFGSSLIIEEGYAKPYSDCSVGTHEPWMTDGPLPKWTISSGLSVYKKPQVLSFVLPLFSPIFGPNATHGKLIPMALFQGLEMEFLINSYAFTQYVQTNNLIKGSYQYGSPNITPTPSTPLNIVTLAGFTYPGDPLNATNEMGNRSGWSITRFELVAEIINLEDQIERNIIEKVIQEGFSLPFEQWYLCTKNKYTSGASLNTTIQINHAFDSLKMICLRCIPTDFESYSVCRKHYALSMNLTSIQMRIGTEYIPSTPVTGNCGNIRNDLESGGVKYNYVDFYIQTMKAWGKFFDMNDSTLLNASNYTINQTPFNPKVLSQLTGNVVFATLGGLASGVDEGMLNMALFHNNRCVGRNIIALDTERFDILNSVRSGTNTIQNRPFDILLSVDASSLKFNTGYTNSPIINATYTSPPTSYQDISAYGQNLLVTENSPLFPRPIYLYIWAYYDARLEFNAGEGWQVLGRF